MTEAERKARFWVARKAAEAMKRGPDDYDEAKYLDDDTRRAIADLRKSLFFESGWDEDAMRREITKQRLTVHDGGDATNGA
jgi:hypothetical protein